MQKLIYATSHDKDLVYRTGVHTCDPVFFFDTGDASYLFLDHREFDCFTPREGVTAVRVEDLLRKIPQGTSSRTAGLAHLIITEYGDTLSATVSPNFPVGLADALRERGITLSVASSLYPERFIKAPHEVSAIREALKLTQESAFSLIEHILSQSQITETNELMYEDALLTSERMKSIVEASMIQSDLMNTDGIIISCGEHAAAPHHMGSGPLYAHQTIVCDIFPQHRRTGYYADMTRTYVKGETSEDIQRMHDAVRIAQEAAMDAIRPGIAAKDIHGIAMQSLTSAGFKTIPGKEGFTHSTGHGIGLSVHESIPSISLRSDVMLAPGHVFSVEPGLYYKNIGGVRIEDLVVVTEDGYENLTQYYTKLEIR